MGTEELSPAAQRAVKKGDVLEMRKALADRLAHSKSYECACCGQVKFRPFEEASVEIYEPRDLPITRMRPSVYVICNSCLEMPSGQVHVKVTQYLAARGTFS